MNRFFATVEEVKADLAQINGLQQEVVRMHEASKTLVKSKEVQRSRQEMQVRGPSGAIAMWW
jgi:hypothetical protein